MINYYRINVSRNDEYLFATENGENGGGIQSVDHYNRVIDLLKEKFPENEGFKVTATYFECRGKNIK